MKKNIYILISGLFCMLLLASCSEWLDEKPKTNVPGDEIFERENGFISALAGLYITMTNEDTYGKNMTIGLVEQLAQMYDKLPDGTYDRTSVYIYDKETSGAFNTKGTLANIWQAQYHIIANANNLLKWLDINGEVVIKNENTRNMIRGEALAIRAFLHFDILRGWGPMHYAKNPDRQEMKCMPYRTVADKSKQPLLTAKEVVDRIVADLDTAKQCLSYEKNLDLGSRDGSDRRFRFNYHAINALLARVYNYCGDKEAAKNHALDVIRDCGLSLQSGNDNDPVLSNEVICGLSMHELVDNMSDYFAGGDKINTKYYIKFATLNTIFETFGTESEDMRAKSSAFIKNTDHQMAITRKYIDNDNQMIPLVRLPEMYYIACESSEGEEAASYINKVRNKRGISTENNVSCDTEEMRTNALDKEFRKEFYAEGQYFWFMKSHGITGAIGHCPEVILTEEDFIFPLPDREKEYGWTSEDNEEGTTNEADPEV